MRQTLDIQPLTGAIGAEIFGIDLSTVPDEATVKEIRKALLDHCVIFFRDQALTAAQQKAFARKFGKLYAHPYVVSDDPEVLEVRREPGDTRVVGDEWHSDTSQDPTPPMGSIFYGEIVPPYGGDTLFANQYLAYESLSDTMKRHISGLVALHSDRYTAGPQAQKDNNKARATKIAENPNFQETTNGHPVVRTHPETGRKALYVNRTHTIGIEGMSEAESRLLLEFLFEHGNRPEFGCRFRWRQGSVAFWDNRCSKHYAVNDTGKFRRLMRRVQVCGDKPV